MSPAISLFSGYSQKENRVTNYALLVLKMLYEENPKYLGEALGSLIGEGLGDKIGVSFRQQERKRSTIPDGLITQPAVTIYIETKNYDWFYDKQLEAHLSALHEETPGLKILLALGKFDSRPADRFSHIRRICDQTYSGSIAFADVSFEDFLQALQRSSLPKNLQDTITDFEAFLNEEDLLPSWQYWLDVVNCAGHPDDVTDAGAYLCPQKGGAYTHARCKYFGMYSDKRVSVIAPILALVDLDLFGGGKVLWHNEGVEAELIPRAAEIARSRRPGEPGLRVMLLGTRYETDFRKDSPGGMLASKKYFDVRALDAAHAADLAHKLRGRDWSSIEALRRLTTA